MGLRQVASLFSIVVITSLMVAPSIGQTILPVTTKYNRAIPATMNNFTVPEMANHSDPIVSEEIDLSTTIQRFAELTGKSPEEARLESLLFMGMTPQVSAVSQPNQNPTFRPRGDDRFFVTARKSFFDSLPSMKLSLELGKKQVFIKCQMISIDPKQAKRLNAFITPGTAEVYSAKIPQITPVATRKTELSDDQSSPHTFVSSSTITRKSTPVITGLISKSNVEKLREYLASTKTETIFAPNMQTFPGQLATINNTSSVPFVVGLEAVNDDFDRVLTQPVVQAIEVGITVRLRAIPHEDKIQLLSDIALSEVAEVQTYTFSGAGEKNQQRIQVPEQNLRQVHLSTLIGQDSAVLIDPNFVSDKVVNRKGPVKRKSVFILEAKMLPMSE